MKIPKAEMIKNSVKDMKHKYLHVGFPHNYHLNQDTLGNKGGAINNYTETADRNWDCGRK